MQNSERLKAITYTEKNHLPKSNPSARNNFNRLYETVPITTLQEALLWSKYKYKNLRVIPESVLPNRSFIQYVRKFSEKNKTFCPLIRTRTCAYQGVRNVSFSENFTYLLNERFQMENVKCRITIW